MPNAWTTVLATEIKNINDKGYVRETGAHSVL
jgi:hypothetical protein